jgi:hypothetical protein
MSAKPALRGEKRDEVGRQMAALIAAEGLTIAQAGARFGLHKNVAFRIAKACGVKSDPDALRAVKIAALGSEWHVARSEGVARAQAAAQQHRDNLAAERRERVERIRNMALTMTRADISAATGLSENAVKKLLKGVALPSRSGRHGSRMAARIAEAAEARMERAEALRAYVATHAVTVSQAGLALGMSIRQAQRLAGRYQIKATKQAVVARARAVAVKRVVRTVVRRLDDSIRAAEAKPNPRLSAAQQANVQRGKAAMRAILASKTNCLPPPPNADELIREAIAAGKVTRCPPRCAAPVNNGTGL